jgi:hypothetical protein
MPNRHSPCPQHLRPAALLLLVLAFAGAALVSGCQTTRIISSHGGPMPPKPRPMPPQPVGIVPTRMAFLVGVKPEDSNGNNYPDLIVVAVYLFAPPYGPAISAEGSFTFSMYARGQIGLPGVEPIARWERDAEAARAAMFRAPVGPGYQFRLSLLETIGDVYPLREANLVCRFEPAGGADPFRSDSVRTIQIGRGRANAMARP